MSNNFIFFDAHAHNIKKQNGGFLIGLEGEPFFQGTLSNKEVIELSERNINFFPVEYIMKNFNIPKGKLVKFHPRREKYTSIEVINFLNKINPSICIIDTLNFPYWNINDYLSIVNSYDNIQFLFPHAGGIDIRDFIKLCLFLPNVWLDFSLTQEYYQWTHDYRKGLVNEEIEFCLDHDKIKRKILYGSDYPFFSQSLSHKKYLKHPNSKLFLVDNFISLCIKTGLSIKI